MQVRQQFILTDQLRFLVLPSETLSSRRFNLQVDVNMFPFYSLLEMKEVWKHKAV